MIAVNHNLDDSSELYSEVVVHQDNVAIITEKFCKILGVMNEDVILCSEAAQLHDIGKYYIKDKRNLSSHCNIGARLVRSNDKVKKAIKFHHENWNGVKSPFKLSGFKIPLYSRIIRITDKFEKLQRSNVPNFEITQILEDGRFKIFDPLLVKIFNENIKEISGR